ncbi:MAG: hypothetical protein NVSMB31_14640 [Vulcanimicrobiaceae bacterium]
MLANGPTTTADGPAWDQKEMTFTEHLRELRKRLLISISSVGLIALFMFLPSHYVIRWLTQA